MPLDYETLRIVWWLLLGVLLIGFAIMDGFDLGAAIWLPWIAENDIERRIVINTIGPTWEGNQVWFILGGGAIFAAWPALYAASFSGFYLAMLVVLLALILRPVGFKYRSKLQNTRWRAVWDYCLFIGGFVPSLIFGVAIGNVLQGVPFYYDDSLRFFYTGGFFALLNPFAILCGVVSVVMLAMHGAAFLSVKTEGLIRARAIKLTKLSACFLILLFAIAGVYLTYGVKGYAVVGQVLHDGPSNPLHKTVELKIGAWLTNYYRYPWMLCAPVIGFVGALLAALGTRLAGGKFSFVCSAFSIFGIISTVGLSIFPFLLPSSLNPNHSLIIWDSSSSQLTLFIMLIATVIFIPIVVFYTAWVYRVLRGRISAEYITQGQGEAY